MNGYLAIVGKWFPGFSLPFQFLFLLVLSSPALNAQDLHPDIKTLNVGQRVERTIHNTELHAYAVGMKRGQVLRVSFFENGANVSAVVMRDADQQPVSAGARSGRGFMRESLTMVADKDGVYYLMVRAQAVTDASRDAKYAFLTSLADQASERDMQRIEGEALLDGANQIFAGGDKEKLPAAVAKIEQSLADWRLLGDTYWEAISNMYLGDALVGLGNFSKAESSYLDALKLFDKTNNRSEVANVYMGMAGLYFLAKDEEKTKQNIDLALEIFKSLGDQNSTELLSTLNFRNLAGFAEVAENGKLPDYDKEIAAARAKRDTSTEASIWAKDVFHYAFDGEGDVNRALFVRAESEGLTLIRRISDRNAEMQILIGLGMGYMGLGDDDKDEAQKTADYTKSKDYLIQGLALSKISNSRLFEGFAYGGLNSLYGGENDRLAIFFGKKFINSLLTFRESLKVADKESQQFFLKLTAEVYDELASDLMTEHRLQEAHQVMNFGRDQEFLDFKLTDAQPPAKVLLTLHEARIEPFFDNFVEDVVAKYAAGPNANYQIAAGQLKNVFDELEQTFEAEATDKDILTNVPDSIDMQSDLRELSTKTGKKHAAIYLSADSLEVLLITPDKLTDFRYAGQGHVDLGDNAIEKLLTALRSPNVDPRPLGAGLFRSIFYSSESNEEKNKTLQAALDNYGAEVLLWSLAGPMRYIPMAALYDDDTKQYLVEKYENVLFTRARKERFLTAPKPWSQGVGFGTSLAYDGFASLPGVTQEVSTIFGDAATGQKGFFDGRVFLDKAFTRQSLLAISQIKPPLVHIASHFSFQPGDAKNSFLLLGDGSRFSLLDMQQSLGLFDGVDLLTLSACQTAAQQSDATGKEIDGFAELAQRLGARSVIATLWQIDDAGTSMLMSEFYRLRKENPNAAKSEILRLAQLNLLNGKTREDEAQRTRASRAEIVRLKSDSSAIPFKPSPDAPFAHPYYWAPFIFFGSSNGDKTPAYALSKPAASRAQNTSSRSLGSAPVQASDMVGKWEGVFGQEQYACTLDIEGVDGDRFYGTLRQKGAEIRVIGTIDPVSHDISFLETKILSLGSFPSWSLGTDRGALSYDGNSILGTGVGGTITYKWSFSRSGVGAFRSQSQIRSTVPETLDSRITPQSIEARLNKGQVEETIADARQFLRSKPDNAKVNMALGLALLAQGSDAEGFVYLDKGFLAGEPISINAKRHKFAGDLLRNGSIELERSGMTLKFDDHVYETRYTSISNFEVRTYGQSGYGIYIQGKFTDEDDKEDKKEFNVFAQTATVANIRNQYGVIVPIVFCDRCDGWSAFIVKLFNHVRYLRS